MLSIPDHKLQSLPSKPSSFALEKNYHTSTMPKIHSKQPSIARQISIHESSSPLLPSPLFKNNDSHYRHDSISGQETTKAKNVEDVIKKASKKLNFGSKDKTRRFEEKMKVFENLSTFIDIKDYIQQMNPMNQDNNKKTVKLPPIQTSQTPSENNSPGLRLPQSTKVKQINMDSVYENSTFITSTFTSPTTKSARTVVVPPENDGNSSPLKSKIRRLQTNIAKVSAYQEEKALDSERKKDAYGMILDKASVMLTQINEEDMKLPVVEDSDANAFYQELQDNLVNNNFERMDYGNYYLQQDEKDYYKNLLAFKDDLEIDHNYYQDYKARADKVITLLRKATKNIYKKVIDTKKSTRYRQASEDSGDRGFQGGTRIFDQEDSNIKQNLMNQFNIFLQSGKHPESLIDQALMPDLQAQFRRMQRQVNTISNKEKGRRVASMCEDEIQPKINPNHEINKVYKSYMKSIIDCADIQGNNYKIVKDDFKKKIDRIEAAYNKEIQQFMPKGLESIKMTLDIGTQNYSDKPIPKVINRKALNALG